jgi:hypothetical protein
MAMTNFRAQDMRGDTKIAYARGGKTKSSSKAPDPDAVPEGTAAEVMQWVGDDPDRAQKALDAEGKAEQPRVTLSNDLQKLIDENVPRGSIDDVNTWVGDDLDRARQALEFENSQESPRVTLVEALEKQLTPEPDPEDDES